MVVGSLNEQIRNPELETSGPDVPTRRRRLHLRAATARMKAAALGQDLDMHDAGEAQKPTPHRPLPPGRLAGSSESPLGARPLLLTPHPLPCSFILRREPAPCSGAQPLCPLTAPSSTCS